jgi:hypothetical protein
MRRPLFAAGVIGIVFVSLASPIAVLEAQAPAGRGAGSQPPADNPDGAVASPDRIDPPAPRRPDGTVNFAALPGGKGFWNNGLGSLVRTGDRALPTNLTIDEVPFRPWAKALYEFRRFRGGLDDPHVRCQPAGGVRFFTVPNGMEFIQQPELNRIIMIEGENREWRRVAMEPGRQHPPEEALNPSYFGDSIGWWEGDTLVVDTVGFNEKFWMIRGGLPHTKFLHLTERFTRISFNQMKYEVTVDDKGAYTRTWSGGWVMPWQTTGYDGSDSGEIHEYFCIDNERDSENMPDR